MRPTKLIMSAFGPYPNEVVLDLTLLSDKGMYLITGDTGAGKTTIFDAITYALFGGVSGDERQVKSLRSLYADEKTKTYVKLWFTYMNEDYYVERKLRYNANKDTVTQDAELTMPDGSVIAKSTSVNQAIQDILQVDRNQFCTIAMIAQGNFQKILNADTKDRVKLFQDLFHTSKYRQLMDTLTAKKKEQNDKRVQLLQEIEALLHTIHVEEELNAVNMVETITKITTFNESEVNVLQELNAQLQKKETELEKLRVEDVNNEKILHTYESVQNLEAKIVEQNQKIEIAKKQLQEAEDHCIQEQIDTLKVQYASEEKNINKYVELSKRQSNLQNMQSSLVNTKNTHESLVKQSNQTKQDIVNTQQQITEIEEHLLVYTEQQVLLTQLQEKQRDVRQLLDNVKVENQKMIEEKKAKQTLLEASQLAEQADLAYTSARSLFYQEQAGLLAQQLQPDQPCPVCGSIHHPSIAHVSSKAPTQAKLEQLEKQADTQQKQAHSASVKLTEVQTIRTQLAQDIDTVLTRMNESRDTIGNYFQNISKQLQEVSNTIRQLDSESKQKISFTSKLKTLEESKQKYEEQIHNQEVQIENLSVQVQREQDFITTFFQELKYKNEQEARNALNALQKSINQLQNQYTLLQENYRNQQQIGRDLQVQLSTHQEALPKESLETFKIKVNSCKQKLLEEQTQYQNDQNTYMARQLRLETNAKNLKVLQSTQKKLEKVEEAYYAIAGLSDTADSRLSGMDKLTLEEYVQMQYLDSILVYANRRYRQMSNGQYELVRHEVTNDKQSHQALNLDVKDHYNDTIRAVSSLSGGESFLASMALALGLSDETMEHAHIQMDTMFIDEGFGSLDDDSLNQAIQTLSSISEGNRLIGIISHVNSLQSRIPRQIVVKKDLSLHGGSTAKIITE